MQMTSPPDLQNPNSRTAAELARRLRDAGLERLAFFLDFDGTLVEIAPSPEQIAIRPGLSHALALLSERTAGATAIITGRGRDFVRARLDLPQLEVIGLHGRDDGKLDAPMLPQDITASARRYAANTHGVIAEDKGGAFALHYRLAPMHAAEVRSQMEELARRAGPGYRLQAGKAVWELCPAEGDKGSALRRLMQRPPFRGRLPVAIGDDLTDEAMFSAVNALGGVSIHVGGRTTSTVADNRLADPSAVRALIGEVLR